MAADEEGNRFQPVYQVYASKVETLDTTWIDQLMDEGDGWDEEDLEAATPVVVLWP